MKSDLSHLLMPKGVSRTGAFNQRLSPTPGPPFPRSRRQITRMKPFSLIFPLIILFPQNTRRPTIHKPDASCLTVPRRSI